MNGKKSVGRLRYFLNNGYLHGIRYLGDRCNIYGKFFWLIVLILSAVGMGIIYQVMIKHFYESSININVDTSYLHLQHTYPAISICMVKGRRTTRIKNILREHMAENNIPIPKKEMSYIKYVHNYLFVNPNSRMEPLEYCETLNETCGIDWKVLNNVLLPHSCSEILRNVTYLGEDRNCEDFFKLHKTEMGRCFTANSISFHDLNTDNLPLKYNRTHHNRRLTFKYIDLEFVSYTLYIHSPEEVPYFNIINFFNLLKSDTTLTVMVRTTEIMNSPSVREVHVDQRACRFPDEKLIGSYQPYSFSSCFIDLRIQTEISYCNCTIPSSPDDYENLFCDYTGLNCLGNHEITQIMKSKHYRKETLCVQSCIEMEINQVGSIETTPTNIIGELPTVIVDVVDIPTKRYIRNLAVTKLDLVVSIGGVAGLFFGASLLSIAEIFYIWCVRKF